MFALNLLITSNWHWIWFTIATFFNKCPNPFLWWGEGGGIWESLQILQASTLNWPPKRRKVKKFGGDQSSNNRMSILSKKCLLQKIEGAPRGLWPPRVPSALGLAPRAVQPALARMNTVSDEWMLAAFCVPWLLHCVWPLPPAKLEQHFCIVFYRWTPMNE